LFERGREFERGLRPLSLALSLKLRGRLRGGFVLSFILPSPAEIIIRLFNAQAGEGQG